tara:strand:- start:5164 stop:6525 length:1362 start_codon:yes stop_codon:yes gene_type:complete
METFTNLLFYLEYLFWFVLVFTIIVFIHEFGHYYVARLNKVKVDIFSIGFGPTLFKYKDKNNTIWQVCAVPLGGYVKFAGEMYPDNASSNKKHKYKELFMNKSSLQKASVVIAGPLANFILGIFLFVVIFIFFGKNFTSPIIGYVQDNSPAYEAGLLKNDKILFMNGNKINSFEDVYSILDDDLFEKIEFNIQRDNKNLIVNIFPDRKIIKTFIGSKREINFIGFEPLFKPLVSKVIKDSPAYNAGMKPNDKIAQIDGKKTDSIKDVISIIQVNADKNLDFLINRNNSFINLQIKPNLILNEKGEKKGVIGIQFSGERKKIDFFSALKESSYNFFIIIKKTLIAFVEIIFGKRDHCEVGGPILIAKVSNDMANQDLVAFISLIALISINLGLINLFPLPLLDGGHFFTYLYEFANKKQVTKVFYKYFQSIGAFLIISLMFFSIFNDIYCRILN